VVLSGACDVEVLQTNELVQSMAVDHHLRVPASLDSDGQRRSATAVPLPVRTVLKLRAGAPYLEVVTTVDNQARDHRLRLLFPTALDTDTVYADGHFMVSAREANPAAADAWHQPPPDVHPHHTWFAASDGRQGLAVLSEGLPEHAGVKRSAPEKAGHEMHELGDADGLTLALTLLRSVGWLSRGDLCTRKGHSGPARATPNAQCLGTYTFRYGLLPFQGGPVEGGVPAQTARFDAPPVVHVTEAAPGPLPPRQSIVSLEPDTLLLTALKRTEEDDRLLLRFHSVAPSPVQATIGFGFRAREAFRALASENLVEPLTLDDDGSACVLEVKPAEIVTVVVSFARPLEPLGA
jgi:alpha-mannosidase